jgi:hypothetical protein
MRRREFITVVDRRMAACRARSNRECWWSCISASECPTPMRAKLPHSARVSAKTGGAEGQNVLVEYHGLEGTEEGLPSARARRNPINNPTG